MMKKNSWLNSKRKYSVLIFHRNGYLCQYGERQLEAFLLNQTAAISRLNLGPIL